MDLYKALKLYITDNNIIMYEKMKIAKKVLNWKKLVFNKLFFC